MNNIRYNIEHRLLKDHFFSNPSSLIAHLLEDDGVFHIYSDIMKQINFPNPYQKENFHVYHTHYNSEVFIISLVLPKPEYIPLCYRIYLLCSPSFEKLAYYTIEHGIDGDFLCCWSADKVHLNLGKIAKAEWNDKEKGLQHAIETVVIAKDYCKKHGISDEPNCTDK